MSKPIKWFVLENTWLPQRIGDITLEHGWGNGYVLIPKDHKLWGLPYEDFPVEVHYGLTYGCELSPSWIEEVSELSEEDLGSWCIGFDTSHYNDNLQRWPKEAVEAETIELFEQILKL